MPNENTVIYTNGQTRGKSKTMACLLAAIITGVIIVILFNSKGVPFARSLNRQPVQLVGLVLIVAATFGLVILCVRCLVMSSNPTPLTSATTYTFRTYNQPPNPYYPNQLGASRISGAMNQPPMVNAGYSPSGIPSGQTYTQHQMAAPQTPPPEFEFPPSYAEATKGLPVIK